MGYLYFLQATRSGLVKIGRATSYRARLSAIRSQSPEPIRVLGIVETADPVRLEAQMHQRFARLRAHGEWFRPDAAMLGLIQRDTFVPEDEWSPKLCDFWKKQHAFGSLFSARCAS
jgi:hypothetical protein